MFPDEFSLKLEGEIVQMLNLLFGEAILVITTVIGITSTVKLLYMFRVVSKVKTRSRILIHSQSCTA